MYINKDGNLYQGDMQVGDREATNEEIKEWQEKQELLIKINEAQSLLDKTQHKFGGDYEPKEGEDLESLRDKRSIARKFIRENRKS